MGEVVSLVSSVYSVSASGKAPPGAFPEALDGAVLPGGAGDTVRGVAPPLRQPAPPRATAVASADAAMAPRRMTPAVGRLNTPGPGMPGL